MFRVRHGYVKYTDGYAKKKKLTKKKKRGRDVGRRRETYGETMVNGDDERERETSEDDRR